MWCWVELLLFHKDIEPLDGWKSYLTLDGTRSDQAKLGVCLDGLAKAQVSFRYDFGIFQLSLRVILLEFKC